tara:strand:+ start:124 stop:1155 length:1032 start_codon:yes stop_codon:yes gene_type:complete
MKKNIAIVTGITGQDGSYLADFLLKHGYVVYGSFRRSASLNLWRLDRLKIREHANLHLVECDITDITSVSRIIKDVQPDEFYNLAAQSFVAASFNQPLATSLITGIAVTNILESIRQIDKKIKFYQASSSEMYGKVSESPQNEKTKLNPVSPYAISKTYAHFMTSLYGVSYGLEVYSGILFNHESPLRGLEFVTRKITHSAAMIKTNKLEYMELGNLNALRDWGHARDYVRGMWMMMQSKSPGTYVLSTGEMHSVREFVEITFRNIDIDIEWRGEGLDEVGINKSNGNVIVKINEEYFRPHDVQQLLGDSSKAHDTIKWKPEISFNELCKEMIEFDMQELQIK